MISNQGKQCSRDDCQRPAVAKGLCRRHYQTGYYVARRSAGSNVLSARPVVDKDWKEAERAVGSWLYRNGIKNAIQRFGAPFDLLCENGARIDVKWCAGIQTADHIHWKANLHHAGKLNEANTDFYVFRLGGYPALGLGATFHVVIPAPLEVMTIEITPRSLITKWGKNVEAVDLIKNFVAPRERVEVAELALLISGNDSTADLESRS